MDSGVTKSGRVWRKVPESDAGIVARSVPLTHSRVALALCLVTAFGRIFFSHLRAHNQHVDYSGGVRCSTGPASLKNQEGGEGGTGEGGYYR